MTPAAPRTAAVLTAPERSEAAESIALELEGRRRSATLGGGLLLIPAAAGAATAFSAALGIPVTWLPLCALLGSAIGPALTTACIAASSVFGVPALKQVHRRRCRALGLSSEEIEAGWRSAGIILDEKARRRLGRETEDGRRERAEAGPGQG
jgi:hypothetical protein